MFVPLMKSSFIFVAVLSLSYAFPTKFESDLEEAQESKRGEIWAVLIAGSDGWWNYRHQADVCHAWHTLTSHGVKPENIITMMYDDIANHSSNKFPGKVFNSPEKIDVYEDVRIDYSGEDVNLDNFLSVLLGNATSGKPVLKSTNKDKVFVYYTDHGGPGVVGLPTGPFLSVKDLSETLKEMEKKEMFNELTFYLEACHSGSMFQWDMGTKTKIYAVTASNAHESSWGTYCPGSEGCELCNVLETCLGDLFSVNWMEHSDKANLRNVTLAKQFEIVKEKTKETNETHRGSEVQAFGNMQIQQEFLSEFMGGEMPKRNQSETFGVDGRQPSEYSLFKSGDIPSLILAHRQMAGDKKAGKELDLLQEKRNYFDGEMAMLVDNVLQANGKEYLQIRHQILTVHPERITQIDCHHQVMHAFSENCFEFAKSPYAMANSFPLVNLCEMNIPARMIQAKIMEQCHAANSLKFTDEIL